MSELFKLSSWLLDRHVESGRGERIAVRAQGRSLSYASLLTETMAAAGGLRELGLRPGDRAVLVLRDTVELVAAFLGAIRIGVIPVLVNQFLTGQDVASIAALTRARVLLAGACETAVALGEGAPDLEVIATTDPDGLHTEPGVAGAGLVRWHDLLDPASEAPPYDSSHDSPAFWLCTSGTTGRPKLVIHRQASPRLTAETYAASVLGIDEDDACYSAGPLFHAYGLGNSLTFPFSVGARAILEPRRPLSPELLQHILKEEQPTLFFGIPTLYAALLAAGLPEDTFASVRIAVSAAEPLPAETWRASRERFGIEILDGIGSTEALHIFISNRVNDVRPGTSGTPVPGYEARLVDDGDRPVAADVVGHLEIRGESFATGHWHESGSAPPLTQRGWLRTGDLYTCSKDGYYTYLGRSDDMLRVSGEWVSPTEVEGVLIEHADVLEAAVIGEHDERGTLRPIAYVTLVPGGAVGPEELGEFCRSRLVGYKRPRVISIVDELPKTTTGKIQRFRLRSSSAPEPGSAAPG